jgi:hypothetical protein
MKNRNVKFISSFFAALMLFVSCSQYDSDLSTSSVDLKSIHQTVKTDWSDMKKSDNSDFEIDVDSYQKEFDLNFRYGQENGLDEMFRKNGLDPIALEQLQFYIDNEHDTNVYDLLNEKYEFDEYEARFLFNLIETYEYVDSLDQRKISWGCALAIAGTVAVTAGAAFVTGGATLIVFLVGKGIATAALIEACGDGWGDISIL